MIIKKGTQIFRGGRCQGNFYTLDPASAKLYGKLCTFSAPKNLRLFVITHASLSRIMNHLSKNLRLSMSFIFGTYIFRKNQSKVLGLKNGGSRTPGQRISIVDIDKIVMDSFFKEFLKPRGFDGAFMPPKRSKFHKGIFHGEMYIPRMMTTNSIISELFVKYTKGTTRLIKPYRKFVVFLSGGMAIKLYLRARGIETAPTSDFDFKFAVPSSLNSQNDMNVRASLMKNIMEQHVNGFVKFLNRVGIKCTYIVRELEGVPLSKPGGSTYKKVYKVYNFSLIIQGREKPYELIDTSLVVVPGIKRDTHLNNRWVKKFRMPIQKLTYMWKDTLYILAGSFVKKDIMLRNPIDGAKKEKGMKNALRVGHLSFLTAKRKGTRHMVNLARKLISNIIIRNKSMGIKHSRQILKHLQRHR